MELRFRDHASFHRAAAGMTAGAALLGFAAAFVAPRETAPLIGGVLGIGIGAAFAYGSNAWRVVVAMFAAAVLFRPEWQTLLASSVMLGVALTIGERGVRALATLFVGMAVAALAMWSALRVTHAERTVGWMLWEKDLVAAGAMGIVGVLAMLPRHLAFASDPVQAAVRALPTELDSEVRALCGRAVTIWSETNAKLGADDPGMALVRDGVLKALEVAAKSAAIRPHGGSTDDELARRMDELDKRIAATTDDEIRGQYQSARAALSDQRRYRDGIRQNRERLVARLHNHVAALEKFQLAAGGLAAARAATTATNPTDELAELSQSVAASGEALAEVELA
ncbi:MAG TPA: hypothetical protein VGL61_07030 [Kofleriaceae bacterium]|jgi:hypothetical protein